MLDVADGYAKSIFTVWGANHNFFNTEWQISDAVTCVGGQRPLWDVSAPRLAKTRPELAVELDYYADRARSGVTGSEKQQRIGAAAMVAFFGAHVGASRDDRSGSVFDPQFRLPRQLSDTGETSRVFSRSGAVTPLFGKHGDPVTLGGSAVGTALTDAVKVGYESSSERFRARRICWATR